MRLSDLQKSVEIFSRDKGFDKSTIEQRALFLMTEIGEVIEEVIKISYHPDADNIEKIKYDLGLELYDVIWNICDLANKLDIDLERSARLKSEINNTRTWK